MSDFFQNGIITTLHDFETKSTKLIEEELLRFSKERKMELILPCLFSELKGDDCCSDYAKTFKHHFADWKNELTKLCSGDYIFQIDADELPHKILIEKLPSILEGNPDNEVYLVPRVNKVSGLTEEHIEKWGWKVDSQDRVNWPDYQWRIWKNKPNIKWVNKVHEKLEGFETYALLPGMPELALYHPKTITKQEEQNNYYNTL